MDRILAESNLDAQFLDMAIQAQGIDVTTISPKAAARFALFTAVCLRSNVARILLGLAHRPFVARLADSPLLQWFLQVGEVDEVCVFAKSTSDRFERWVSAENLRTLNAQLIALSMAPPTAEGLPAAFGMESPVVCDELFLDTTCVKTHIHFPVDWVLLRDAVRTLMKATICVRRAGLKCRMPQSPEAFMRDMNKLCIAMSAQRRSKEAKRGRKRILRAMKTLSQRIARHARAHRDVLEKEWPKTERSQGQARVIIARIDGVIEQLPAAIKQAHERIIGGRQVANSEKILSIYDADIEVIVRGKAGAEVEFGNKFTLIENRQGLIIDYELHDANPGDSTLVKPSIERLPQAVQSVVKKLWSDRGMHSKNNVEYLEEKGIQSGLCPRDPQELSDMMKEPGVREGMKRRANTEARIGIFKNVFLGNPSRGKSHGARKRASGWAVLAHNLWVLAREPQARAKEEAEQAKAA